MAETAQKTNQSKNTIIGVCVALIVIVVIAVVVAIIIATKGSGGISDSFFKTDDTKYVMKFDAADAYVDGEDITPVKSYIVYFRSGDTITGMSSYFKFASADIAKDASQYYINQGGYESVSVNGEYVVAVSKPSDYKDLTPESVEEQIEFVNMLNRGTDSDIDEYDPKEGVDIIIEDETVEEEITE